jgi:hypothetical protein
VTTCVLSKTVPASRAAASLIVWDKR